MPRFAWISLSLVAALGLGGSALAEDAAAPQQVLARILGQGLDTAHERLRAKFVFLPFALVLHKGGDLEQIGGHSGDELDPVNSGTLEPNPAKLLTALEQRVAREAKSRGDFVAVGIFSDAEIKLPDGRVSAAIQADLEHPSGTCQTVFEPYGHVDDESLAYASQISLPGKGAVFRCK